LTVDLEPWMCYYDTHRLDKRLDNNQLVGLTKRILKILEKHGLRATFFVMGEVYNWYPSLIKEIAQAGHEIAFHTSAHAQTYDRDLLLRELRTGSNLLKRFKVRGFRAARMTLHPDAVKILRRNGFKYDSSLYAPLGRPFRIGGMVEVPISTYPLLKGRDRFAFPRNFFDALRNIELPFGSGYFVGLLSPRLLNRLIESFNKQDKSAVFFIHPWQLSEIPGLPTTIMEKVTKFPYRMRISKEKMESILSEHYFTTIGDVIKEHGYL